MMGKEDKAARTSVKGIMSIQERFAGPKGDPCSALRVGGGWSGGPRGTAALVPNQGHSGETQTTARKLLQLLHTLTKSF